MNKKKLTEQEIRTRYITPAIQQAGWKPYEILEERYFTDGRFNIQQNGKAVRGEGLFADYCLEHKKILLAIV